MKKYYTTESFIEECKKIHKDKYNYSLTKYINSRTKIKIICYLHGIFEQLPNNHLKKHQICPKCSNEQRFLTIKEFIEKSRLVHGNKYDYSLVDYKNNKTKVKIICSIHGIFEQISRNHLKGNGCPKCEITKRSSGIEEFIKKSEIIHYNKYDYSLVKYKNNYTKVKIICPVHGIFLQTPNSHTTGNGCPKCAGKNKKTEDFITESKNIHGNKYDYSLIDYKNAMKKIKLICPIHGIFEQTPNNHLSKKYGCPLCKESKGEQKIAIYMDEYNIPYERQYRFEKLPNLPFDFYIKTKNLCIEFDGMQHYGPVEFFGGYENFIIIQKNDNIKNKFCKENNINLLRIKYKDINKVEKMLEGYIS